MSLKSGGPQSFGLDENVFYQVKAYDIGHARADAERATACELPHLSVVVAILDGTREQ